MEVCHAQRVGLTVLLDVHAYNNILSHTYMSIPYEYIHDHVLYIAMNGLFRTLFL